MLGQYVGCKLVQKRLVFENLQPPLPVEILPLPPPRPKVDSVLRHRTTENNSEFQRDLLRRHFGRGGVGGRVERVRRRGGVRLRDTKHQD